MALPVVGFSRTWGRQACTLPSSSRRPPAPCGPPKSVVQATHLRIAIRGDDTQWLDGDSGPAAASFLSSLQALRVSLNRHLFLGLAEEEAHFACYPVGARYQRHRDQFHDSDARVLSLVSYLNDDWRQDEGGALRLYLPQGSIDVLPHAGTSIVFASEIEHEVLPATRERLSIAAWFGCVHETSRNL